MSTSRAKGFSKKGQSGRFGSDHGSASPESIGLPGGRTLPHNVETEQALIACCIIDGGRDSIGQCVEAKLTAESFYRVEHQIVFSALLSLYDEGIPVDEVILADKLQRVGELDKIGGHAYLANLTSSVEVAAHLPHYLRRVREMAILRRLIKTAIQTVEEAYTSQEDLDHFLENVEQEFFKISEDRISDSAQKIEASIDSVTRYIHEALEHKGKITGVASGFVDLDRMTFGWNPQEMIVVAARPSMGKTSIALNMVEAAVLGGGDREPVPTLFFSLEMSTQQLGYRLLCGRAKVNMQRIKEGFLDNEGQGRLARAAKEFKGAPLWIDDSAGLSVLEIRAKARRLHSRNKLGLVVVDYLQLVRGDSVVPREQQVADISRGMKAMAKELDIPVVVLAQLNRESEKDKRQPRVSDLRESGSIEQDADVVLLLARKKDSDEERDRADNVILRDLIVAKQRNGPTGLITLTFNKTQTRFENFTPQSE